MSNKHHGNMPATGLARGHMGTASTSLVSVMDQEGYYPGPETFKERAERWYFGPLERMEGDWGFICLMALLPIYEKYLRVEKGVEGDITKGSRATRIMGRDLGADPDDAYEFWQAFRNGLLHRAVPTETDPKTGEVKYETVIMPGGVPLRRVNGRLWVNIFAVRDKLLPVLRAHPRMWSDDHTRLPVEYLPRG